MKAAEQFIFLSWFTYSGVAGDVMSLNAEWTNVDGYRYRESPMGPAGEN